MRDRKYLLKAGDGPEAIEIYTSEEQGLVDWSNTFPALYMSVSTPNTSFTTGPFTLSSIYEQILKAVTKAPSEVLNKPPANSELVAELYTSLKANLLKDPFVCNDWSNNSRCIRCKVPRDVPHKEDCIWVRDARLLDRVEKELVNGLS